MKKECLIKKYSEALEEGRAAIFAGSGLSIDAGFVDWKGLLTSIAEELGVKIDDSTNLEDIAQYYENETMMFTDLASTILSSFPTSAKPTRNHEILASLPIRTYWTTNFDKLIESALTGADKIYDVKFSPSSLAISKSGANAIVYKMHGDVNYPNEVIITRNQFEAYEETHKAFLESLAYDLTNKTFLFLGLSFDDPNLKYILKHVRLLYKKNQRNHYYILKSISKDDEESDDDFSYRKRKQELFVEDLKNYGIRTVYIDDYTEITEILSSIKKRYLSRTIFISGAAAEYGNHSEDEVKAFIRKLSASIIHEGFRIVNGYGLGFGNEVLAGAMTQLNQEHKPIDGNLIMKPFPQGLANPKDTWQKYREDMISSTGVSIFLLGNKINRDSGELVNSNGMRDEYEISKVNGNILIPVGATGYMSEELWREQKGNTDVRIPKEEDMLLLGDKNNSLDELHDIIIRILKEQTK